jgi:hypothetical protein
MCLSHIKKPDSGFIECFSPNIMGNRLFYRVWTGNRVYTTYSLSLNELFSFDSINQQAQANS